MSSSIGSVRTAWILWVCWTWSGWSLRPQVASPTGFESADTLQPSSDIVDQTRDNKDLPDGGTDDDRR